MIMSLSIATRKKPVFCAIHASTISGVLFRQPSLEECRVIPVIGNTKFRYRSLQYIARSDRID